MKNEKKEYLIVNNKKFLVERPKDQIIIGGIVAVNKQTDFNGMEDVYKLISEETGLHVDYIFRIFLKSFRKFLETEKFYNLTEALNEGFSTEGFKNWEED